MAFSSRQFFQERCAHRLKKSHIVANPNRFFVRHC